MPKSKKPTKSKQERIPGTHARNSKGHEPSDELRRMLEDYNIAKYGAKAELARMSELSEPLRDRMEKEGFKELTCDIEIDGIQRVAITELDVTKKLKSKLEKEDAAAAAA